MKPDLEASYRMCRRVARRAASNFYYSFYLLPRHKRRGMCALYAYLRRTDDLGDCAGTVDARRSALATWRRTLESALAGQTDDPLLPALVDTIRRHDVPVQCLLEVIDGVEMDLENSRYATFADLERYCHRVAGAVGLACIHIWGFHGDAAQAAEQCGLAFQITNILRDLKEDAARGRIYLPQEDLARFAYRSEELLAGVDDARFRALLHFEIERARQCYRGAASLHQHLSADGRRVFGAMFSTYHRLLEEIDERAGDVLNGRVRLSSWKKLHIAARSAVMTPRLLQRLQDR